MTQFARLLFGPEAVLEDITDGSFMATPSFQGMFLGRVQNACGDGTRFADVGAYISNLMVELTQTPPANTYENPERVTQVIVKKKNG